MESVKLHAGNYVTGENISLFVSFNRNVAVSGTPRIALTVGQRELYASYASGGGTSVLTFHYPVVQEDSDFNGVVAGNSIDLNGSGSIQDTLAPSLRRNARLAWHGPLTFEASKVNNSYRFFSSSGAFAVLGRGGDVVTWGDPTQLQKSTIPLLSRISEVYSNESSFAAIITNGPVVTWGVDGHGGNPGSVATNLQSGVSQIFSSKRAFAALKTNGSVVTWGDHYYGGDSSSASTSLSSGVSSIVSSHRAFAALKSTGAVVTWGDADYGGNSDSVSSSLSSGVTHLFSTDDAFAARKSDGFCHYVGIVGFRRQFK